MVSPQHFKAVWVRFLYRFFHAHLGKYHTTTLTMKGVKTMKNTRTYALTDAQRLQIDLENRLDMWLTSSDIKHIYLYYSELIPDLMAYDAEIREYATNSLRSAIIERREFIRRESERTVAYTHNTRHFSTSRLSYEYCDESENYTDHDALTDYFCEAIFA